MSHFLLFIPGESEEAGKNHTRLEQIGLADLIDGAEFLDTQESPAGSPGLLVAWRQPGDERFHFSPDKQQQTWFKSVPQEGYPAGRYWLGIWNDSPPVPRELRRTYAIPGHYLKLGDGQEWLIPNANELPADRILADDGTWKFEVQRKYHDFYLETERYRQLLSESDESTTILYEDLDRFNLAALRLNYRILPELVSHLRLFTRQNIQKPMFAVTGALEGRGYGIEGGD